MNSSTESFHPETVATRKKGVFSKVLRYTSHLFPWILIVFISFILLKKIELYQLVQVVKNADWTFVAIAVFLLLTVNNFARIKKFAALIRPLPHRGDGFPFWELPRIHFSARP